MLSLVSYGSSGESDNEEEANKSVCENNIDPNEDLNGSNVEIDAPSQTFSSLPTPKSVIYGLDTSKLLYKKPIANKPQTKKLVKITIPALNNFEDLPAPTIRKNTASQSSGLMALLPPPMHSALKEPTRKLMPDVLRKPIVPTTVKKVIPKKIIPKPVDSDDSDGEQTDFFKLNNDVPSVNLKREKPISKTVINPSMDALKPEGYTEKQIIKFKQDEISINNEAIMALCGNKRRRMDAETTQIIDINEAEVRPDMQDWMIKQLTEETNQLLEKMNSGPEPCTLAKRKHQITYLAHQAKVNEIELKNQWAQHRQSRQQTQSKYGF